MLKKLRQNIKGNIISAIIGSILTLSFVATPVYAITLWYLDGTTLKPVDSSWSVVLGNLFGSFEDMATSTNQAKGDILVASSTDGWTNLAVGTNNFVLTADSTEPFGLKWAAAGGGVEELNDLSDVTNTSTSSDDFLLIDGTGKYVNTSFQTTFDIKLSATTTLPNLTTLLGLINASSTQFTATDYFGIKLDDPQIQDSLKIGDPSHIDNLQEYLNHMWSAGTVDGGAITDNANGTVNIAEATAVLRPSASDHVDIYSVIVPAQNNITMVDGQTNYVYVDYNGGSPQWDVGSAITDFNCQDKCVGYIVVREDTTLEILDVREQNVDSNRKLRRRDLETQRFIRVLGGSVISSTNLDLILTAGAFYFGLDKHSHDAVDTTGADTFVYYSTADSGSTWTKTTGQSAIDNLNYNDITTGTTTLGANKYKVDWHYVVNDTPSFLAVLYGQNEYTTLAGAEAEGEPTVIPPAIEGLGALVGRSIVQQNVGTITTESAFLISFQAGTPTVHNGLSGLQGGTTDEYYHSTSAEYTGTGTGNFVRLNAPTLTGLTTLATATSGQTTITGLSWFESLSTFWEGLTASTIIATSSLEIPNGASPTVDAIGEIALQTAPENALIIATSTNASYPGILPVFRPITFNYASTTWTSTSTPEYATLDFDERVKSGICYTDAGTVLVRIGDGTNWSNVKSITTSTTTVTFTSNNVFKKGGEKLIFQVGTPASSPQKINCNFRRYYEL